MMGRQESASDACESPREKALAFIRARPGVCLQEIADHLGMTRNAASHHVRILRKRKDITFQRQGRRVLHFPSGFQNPAKKAAFGLLRQSSVRPILEAMVGDPEISWRSLGRRMDMSPHAVRWHVKRLTREGLIHVIREHDGVAHHVHVHPEIRSILGDDAADGPEDGGLAPAPQDDRDPWSRQLFGDELSSKGLFESG